MTEPAARTMEPLGWHDLATATQGRLIPRQVWGRCERISTDSRDLRSGDVFWALPGDRYDGHNFAAEAHRAGAGLIVCQSERAAEIPGNKLVVDDTTAALGRLARWYRRRQESLIIGVTGSVGKTTTKELVHLALRTQYRGFCSPGNFNNLIGLPKSLLQLQHDDEYAVLEMGASQAGDIRALATMAEPEVGIVTSIGKAHLASFGSLEGVMAAKGELLESLPETGFAVLPGDCPLLRSMASKARCRTIFVGMEPHNEIRATDVVATAQQVTFSIQQQPFQVALPGGALLGNALCAVATALEMGVPLDVIADGLAEFQPLPGRGQVRQLEACTVIDDCYNASPASVAAACERLAIMDVLPQGRRFALLGDMRELGPNAAAEHSAIGARLAQLPIDGLLAFGSHARDLADGALQQGWKSGRVVATDSLEVLLAMLDCWLEPTDLLLIKGSRAMQLERVVEWLEQRGDSSRSLQRSA